MKVIVEIPIHGSTKEILKIELRIGANNKALARITTLKDAQTVDLADLIAFLVKSAE